MAPVAIDDVSPELVEGEVQRILSSDKFARSNRLRSLLRFTVTQALQGNADTLKEYVIGTEVLKKSESYDPRSDSLVRVLASRLRAKLKEYYRDGGSEDPLVIEFPKGQYVPRFQRREFFQTESEMKLRARDAYSHGKFLASKLDEETLSECVKHFQEAIAADPEWPAPRIELARAYAFRAFFGLGRPRDVWPLAKAAADAALQADEMSPDAHNCLGMVHSFFEWRWREGEAHFLKAIARDSYSGAGHLWHALGSLIPMRRFPEADAEIARASELAPAAFIEEGHVLALYFDEQYDAVLQKTARLPPVAGSTNWLLWLRSLALAATRHLAGATELLQQLRDAAPRDHRIISTLGYVHGLAGERDKAHTALAALREQRSGGAWVPNYDLAIVHLGLGNRNDALAWLQESLREREPWMAFLAVDPRLSPLRVAAKFAALAGRVFPEGDWETLSIMK
jgi:hypothetical protein